MTTAGSASRNLDRRRGARAAPRGRRGAGNLREPDGGETWSLLSTLAGEPGSEDWNDPANQPPGHLGLSAIMPDTDDPTRFWAIVQGFGLFETTDDAKTWTPRNRGLRADWPRPHEGVALPSTSTSVRSPTAGIHRLQQDRIGVHDDDCGHTWPEITEGLPTESARKPRRTPHDRDTFHVIPLDPGHGRTMPDGRASVWRTEDAGSSWRRADAGLPQDGAYVGVLREGMANDTHDVPGYYFGTSTGQLFGSNDDAATWTEIAGFLPGISSVEVAVLD